MTSAEEQAENYRKYRGKCKEMSEALAESTPGFRVVRGHYFCPLWASNEPHWWCVDEAGVIHDPTRLQFPSQGHGIYEEFNGIIECSNCGKEMREEDATFDSRYAFCSYECHGRFIGVL